ncbi:hypothetical protein EVAR_20680_1 [Eumeta japonica]|uniref:Uncharacterized protein n=1 Tax=Eumeta variegata TaxID=151549 RepID=A0A4C1VAH9_EUMVA|nr:hypothetical protein EVAR_20680_1 [Eumeta japonica]
METHDRLQRSARDASISLPLHRPMPSRREIAAAHDLHRSVSGVRKLRERSLGAETVRGLGVQTTGLPECVAGTDARGLTVAARRTLRGTPHTHTRAGPDTTERGSKEH